jgi:molybdate transport system substrate-binding protein
MVMRLAAKSGAAAEIRVLSAGAMAEIVRDLGAAYERASGNKVSAEFSRSPLVRDRIRAGEPFDVAITTQSRIEELAGAGKIVRETASTVARSLTGVAVRAGRPKPNIDSVEAFVRTLRDCHSIACADPAFGTASGLHLADLFDRLGLTAELKPKTRLIGAAGGEPVVVCAAVADGTAELGIQQIAEIVSVPGVDLVGPLPPEIQHTTLFAAAVAAAARNQGLARDFVSFFASATARAIISAHGMEPVDPSLSIGMG